MPRVRISLVVFAAALGGCGAGGDGAARLAAVQKALDAHPPAIGSGQAAPFRAHFEPTELGKELIAAGLATRPEDVPNGHATITKDADGNFVAQAQLQ